MTVTVKLALQDIIIDPVKGIDLAALPRDEAVSVIQRAYGFLAPDVEVSINDGIVTITAEAGRPQQRGEAKRFFERALKLAQQGSYARAIELFERALQITPDHVDTRRNLAMAYLESSQIEKAKTGLVETLRLDPNDPWSNLLLGNVFWRHEKDFDNALKWYRKAFAVKPNDAILVTNLGAIMAEQERYQEAAQYFNRAIEVDPHYPNPYYALALLHFKEDEPELTLSQLNDLFENAEPGDARSGSLLNEARKLYLQASERATIKVQAASMQFIEAKKRALEEKTGHRIDVVEDNTLEGVSAVTQMAWTHRRDHHLIKYRRQNEATLPHILLHELEHIALEDAARKAGRNRTFTTTAATRAEAMRTIQPNLYRLSRKGISEAALTDGIDSMVSGLANQLFNIPLDMVIEHNLFEREGALRHSQFVSLYEQHRQNVAAFTDPQIKQLTPARIFKANAAINCAYALFMDHLYGNRTQYAATYKSSNVFNTGQRLFNIWKNSLGAFEPGDEYILVDEFATELKLQSWYEWKTDAEMALASTDRPEGTTNPELLHDKDMASTMYLLGALQRFEDMPIEEVREITFEISMIGVNGIDYASPEQKYTLRSLPDEKFSGLQLLCLMYVGFKIVNPEAETSIDLKEPYEAALQVYRSKKNRPK